MSLKDLLRNKLTKRQLGLVPKSFDIIGNRDKAVIVIEIPKGVNKKAVAEALMKQHKNVEAVLNKVAPRSGVYRTYKLRLIAGAKNTEVLHTESGHRFLVDPRKVYFSPRESTERMRIAEKIRAKELVMVFFAGIGPFPVVIGKKARQVVGIEINPVAVSYFKRNIRLNKLGNVEAVLGDVKKKARDYYGKCDRVLMPLPESSEKYIKEAVMCAKKGGIVHFYCFASESEINKKKVIVRAVAKKVNKKVSFSSASKVLPYGPKIWKYRIDFSVN